MKVIEHSKDLENFSLAISRGEIEELVLYLGHARHAKGLDALNYHNIGWEESAKIAESQRDKIAKMQFKLGELLNIQSHEIQHK